MDVRRWEQIKDVLDAALKCGPDERAHFLDQACGDDRLLRREVESLLSSGDAESFLAGAAIDEVVDIVLDQQKTLSLGEKLSHYEIINKLGEGGMGEVYLARDTILERRVAIKVLRSSIANDEDRLRRFEHEARAISALNHPNLLTIYEFGSQDGFQL